MSRFFDILISPRVIGAVVTCGAVLGIASLIHPTDSIAVPSTLDGAFARETVDEGVSLGSLEGRGFEVDLYAGSPEATVRLLDGNEMIEMSLEEFLYREYSLVPDQQGVSDDAWPEAFMEVDIPTDAW